MKFTRKIVGRKFLVSLLTTLSIANLPSALAHDTFLLPTKHLWELNSNVDIRMASGLKFPDLKWGVSQDRISTSIVKLNGQEMASPSFTNGENFLSINFDASQAGVGIVAMSTKPRSGEIKHEDTEGYLDEIGASQAVRQAFRALPGKPALNRSYVKHTKSSICIESCKDGQYLNSQPVGQKLEFVTVDGNTNRFLLLLDGKPLPNHEVKVRNSVKKLLKFETDSNGQFSIGEKMSGTIMLAAVAITLPEKANGRYHSDYATFVANINH